MNDEDKKDLIVRQDNRIAPWGGRKEVREIAERVRVMAPGAKKLQQNEALALAQGAVSHGLDPFNGEIWYIPGSGLMAGIKGLRKAARNQIEGNFWTEFEEITDPDLRRLFDIPKDALAFRCILRDSETIRAFSDAWRGMKENGVPEEVIPSVLGRKPYTVGIGFIKDGEKTKMDRVQCAMKRAEADALKRRFDLPFAVPTEPNGEVIDGNWTFEEEEKEVAEKAEDAIDALYGEEASDDVSISDESTWDEQAGEEEKQFLVDGKIIGPSAHEKQVVAILSLSPFKPGDKLDIKWFKLYRGLRDEGLKSTEAAKKATQAYGKK